MSDPNKPATAPRIAIKFGAPSSTKNSKKPSKPNPPSTLGKRPRSQAWGGGSDSEASDDENAGRHETITGFGAEGAVTKRKAKDARAEKKDLVISRQPNRDWRADVKAQRKGKNLLPEEARTQQNGTVVETEPADQDKDLKWGLTVKEKRVKLDDDDDSKAQDSTRNSSEEQETPHTDEPKPPIQQESADHEAILALMGQAPERDQAIIPSEEDAYQRDVQRAGEASTLADYESMPVEEFGAALLRGMGWDGKERGKIKEVKRRPNRLGLGAKELKEDEDLGGWNQGGKKKHRPRLNDYRREEEKRKESRRHEDSYKREREREREREKDSYRDRPRERERDHDRRDRHRDHERDRRR